MVDNIIVLNDEAGNEVEFEFLDLVEYDGGEYVVLLPIVEDEADDDGTIVILKVEEIDDETESYESVDDENVLQNVFEIFKAKFKDSFNFEN